MRARFIKQLKGKEAITQSGIYLGKIRDLILDLNSRVVVQYVVKKWPLWLPIGESHLIHHNQVVDFQKDYVIVKDARLNREVSSTQGEVDTNSVVMDS